MKSKKVLKVLQDELNLNHYKIDLFKRADEEDLSSQCDVQVQYLTAHITLSQQLTAEELLDVLCHELCHIITEPLYLTACDAVSEHVKPYLEERREQLTEHIARVFLKNNKKRIIKLINTK